MGERRNWKLKMDEGDNEENNRGISFIVLPDGNGGMEVFLTGDANWETLEVLKRWSTIYSMILFI